MKIYTKTGDKGETSLIGGERVKKTHLRLEAYGTVDELNALIGELRLRLQSIVDAEKADSQMSAPSLAELKKMDGLMGKTQNNLFNLGSHLACSDPTMIEKLPSIEEQFSQALEEEIDRLEKQLPRLSNFILPGGQSAAVQAHICRTVTRRTERHVVRLMDTLDQGCDYKLVLIYLNRLSDYFFVAARSINFWTGHSDHQWQKSSKS